ncbi:MAG: HDOD domain-containing protein [Candidatus Hydrogenedentes bacterium]|nr:HDOD domain-containing protein [Candidatus Hydrogenedentota bacterium]
MNTPGAIKTHKRKRIGELLIQAGIIDHAQLQHALKIQKQEGGKTVELLIRLGYIDKESVSKFLSTQPGTPSIELANYSICPEICKLIPRDFAVENELFPIDKLGKLLTVGMAFPLDLETIQKLEEITGLKVKALLCRPDDIKDAFNQYYRHDTSADGPDPEAAAKLKEALTRLEDIGALLRKIDALPTLPQTVQRAQEAASSPYTAMADIAAIVSEDPAISAALLKLSNSSAYGFRSQVTDVKTAVTLLGLKETCSTVMSSAIIDLTEKSKVFDHERFWTESMFCASAARQIAVARGEQKPSAIFTAALLSDIGRFALAEAAPERYAKLDKALAGPALKDAEEELLGIGHPEAGYVLATHWSLPDQITKVIRFHENPKRATAYKDFSAIVNIAARMAEFQFSGQEAGEEQFESSSESLEILGLSSQDAARLYADTVKAVTED